MTRRLIDAALMLSLAGLPGCGDRLPTELVRAPAEPTPLDLASGDLFADALADARERIESALPAGHAPEIARALFGEIYRAIDSRDPQVLRQALTNAEHVLAGLTDAAGAADLAIELDALRLVLAHARSAELFKTARQ